MEKLKQTLLNFTNRLDKKHNRFSKDDLKMHTLYVSKLRYLIVYGNDKTLLDFYDKIKRYVNMTNDELFYRSDIFLYLKNVFNEFSHNYMKIYNLFLDDVRTPLETYTYTKNSVYVLRPWEIARNYHEFCDFINAFGLPQLISFDHDLGLENSKELNGYDCAKWLVNYCLDTEQDIPEFLVHSMNTVGKQNIISLLENFKNRK